MVVLHITVIVGIPTIVAVVHYKQVIENIECVYLYLICDVFFFYNVGTYVREKYRFRLGRVHMKSERTIIIIIVTIKVQFT